MSDFQQELSVALDAAKKAAQVVMSVYQTNFSVDYKGPNDPVTSADKQANELITQLIHTAFPNDTICAEESHSHEISRDVHRCWFVDPLDGTKEFVNRNGEFAVMIGLAVEGKAKLGVVLAPEWKRLFWGVVGESAWEQKDDQPPVQLHAKSEVISLDSLSMVVSRSHPNALVTQVGKLLQVKTERPCGSVGLKSLLICSGEIDFYVHAGRGPKLWDGCAPDAIAQAAGFCVSNGKGESLRYNSDYLALDQGLIFAPPQLHPKIVDAFTLALAQ